MKLTKTESAILDRANNRRGRWVGTAGRRENNAARKLAAKGLVEFVNESERVQAHRGNRRNAMGDFVSFYVVQGRVRIN